MATLILLSSLMVYTATAISPLLSTVHGPGIHSSMYTLPVQYFYTQLKDQQGHNYTGTVDESLFKVTFNSPKVPRVFVHHIVHYLSKGLFIVKYRIHREIEELILSVTYNGHHVHQSPYHLGNIITDKCYCPSRTIDQWLNDFNCPSVYSQIDNDLLPYKERGIELNSLPKRLANEYKGTHGIHYSIINNKLYAKTFGTITDFRYMSDMILTSLINKVRLPDIELIVQVSDWPQDSISEGKDPFPFLSWCGSVNFTDIVWPQYDLMRHTIQAMDRVQLDMMYLQSSLSLPWDERISKAFFRGRDSNKVRLDLVSRYHSNTDLFNVSLTRFFFHHYDPLIYGQLGKQISLLEFFKYKYQVNIDGTVAAYRMPFLMAGGSVIFKQNSPYYEHFYSQLIPWVHYIPLKDDISDIEDKLQWAINNDNEAYNIAVNAHQFAVDNLLPDKLYCYMYTLLKEYSKLQRGVPKVHEGMIEVTTEEDKWKHTCHLCTYTTTGDLKDEL